MCVIKKKLYYIGNLKYVFYNLFLVVNLIDTLLFILGSKVFSNNIYYLIYILNIRKPIWLCITPSMSSAEYKTIKYIIGSNILNNYKFIILNRVSVSHGDSLPNIFLILIIHFYPK